MRPQSAEPVAARTIPDPHAINCSDRAHAAVVSLVDRIGHPHRGISARLAVLLRDLVNLGTLPERERPTEAEMRAVVQCVEGVIDDMYRPITPEMRAVVRHHESMRDAQEQMKQDDRLNNGDTPFRKREHAKALRLDAAASISYARVLEWEARHEEVEKEVHRAITIERLTGAER